MNLPIWMLEHALSAAHAVVISGMVNAEWRTVNGDKLPMMHLSSDATLTGPKMFNVEANGFWVRLRLEGVEVRSENWSGGQNLILIFPEGVTIQLDFKA